MQQAICTPLLCLSVRWHVKHTFIPQAKGLEHAILRCGAVPCQAASGTAARGGSGAALSKRTCSWERVRVDMTLSTGGPNALPDPSQDLDVAS
eukprot:366278-Chlamydomonas_euryale.AAC.25